jgi:general secretion pathway protein G
MKDAIDRYKDYADKNLIRVEVGSEGYPPDLETLVKSVQDGASADKKIRPAKRIGVSVLCKMIRIQTAGAARN